MASCGPPRGLIHHRGASPPLWWAASPKGPGRPRSRHGPANARIHRTHRSARRQVRTLAGAERDRPAPGALTSDPEHPPGARRTAGPRPWCRRWRLSGAHSSAFLGLAHFQGHETPKRAENGLASAATPPCGRREENG